MRTSERLLAAGLAVLFAATLLPAASQADSLEEARAERDRLQTRLDEASGRLAELEERLAELEAERDEVAERVAAAKEELEEVDERIHDRVRQMFKHGSTLDPVSVFLASDEPTDALSRAETVQRLVRGDRAEVEEVEALRAGLAAEEERLEERSEALATAREEQRELTDSLEADFEQARRLEARLEREEREERERREAERRARERREAQQAQQAQEAQEAQEAEQTQRRAPQPSGGGGMACPVDQPRSFTDTWGAARSGGRQHRGTDIMAPRGTPIRAITSGTWDIQSPGANAGNWAILRGDNGDHYWYMHLQSHTVGDGARVSAGQQTGTNGDTGNARGTPHLHFELHPGGGSAVNPYSLLRRVC